MIFIILLLIDNLKNQQRTNEIIFQVVLLF